MSWNKLQMKIRNMGFDLAFRNKRNDNGRYIPDLTPPDGHGWVYVGNYDNLAAFWIKPLTDSSRWLTSSLVRKIMAELAPFIETVGDFALDLLDADAPILLP